MASRFSAWIHNLWRISIVGALVVCAHDGLAQQVIQVTWPTRYAAEPPTLDEQERLWMPTFQFALKSMPEETSMSFALGQPQLLGLDAAEAARLRALFSNYYARVRQPGPFQAAPSALPYCFAGTKPTHGLATVFVPAKITANTRVIVFLHGDGGSLLAYAHYMANTFSNDVIVCPAYGISPGIVPAQYVNEAINTAARRIGQVRGKPILIGLSAGGVGACRIYAANPDAFDRLICLGSIPPSDATVKFTSKMKVTFISGSREPHIANGSLERQLNRLRLRAGAVQSAVISGADHYFLISHEGQTRKALRGAVQR
jgi:pimeloyl-ACP methyl ester carboxylesterase